MTIAIIALALCAIIGLGVAVYKRSVTAGLLAEAFCAIPVLLVWGVMAWAYSPYQKNSCQTQAEGYGLEDSEWTVRFGCRVYLPGGQLVPENRIRITTDGVIIVTEDE